MPPQHDILDLPVLNHGPVVLQPPAPKKESFAKKLGMGILCSSVVAVGMNFLYIKKFVLLAFAGILWICGWTTEPPKGDEAHGIIAKLEHATKGDAADPSKLSIIAKVKDKVEGKAKDAVVAPVKVAAHDAKVGVQKGVKAVEKKADDIGDKIGGSLKARAESSRDVSMVQARELGIEVKDDWSNARINAEIKAKQLDKSKRAHFLARSRTIGFKVDETLPTDKLQASVEAAEHKYQTTHAQNASCPNCGLGLRVEPRRRSDVMCPRCTAVFAPGRAIAIGPPAKKIPPGLTRPPGMRIF